MMTRWFRKKINPRLEVSQVLSQRAFQAKEADLYACHQVLLARLWTETKEHPPTMRGVGKLGVLLRHSSKRMGELGIA